MKRLLTLLSIAIANFVNAQVNAPDVFPRAQNGNSTNLNAPAVDLSTGVISPSYHLMDANGTDVSTGVDLIYTAGQGVKVHEKASSVGLGWEVKTGGYIKRIVKGVRDEKSYTSNAVTTGSDFFTNVDHEFVYGRFDHKINWTHVEYHSSTYIIPGLSMFWDDFEVKCNQSNINVPPFQNTYYVPTIGNITETCACGFTWDPVANELVSVYVNCPHGTNSTYPAVPYTPPNDTTYSPFPYADNQRVSQLADFYFNNQSQPTGNGISYPTSFDWAWHQFEFLYDVDHAQADGEPDEFYFSFDGYSGSFILDTAGYPVLTPKQNIKIIPAIGPHAESAWEFILPDGTNYYFYNNDSYREHTLSISKPFKLDNPHTPNDEEKTDSSEAITTWFLSSKHSPTGEVISYEYETDNPKETYHQAHSSVDYVGDPNDNSQQPFYDYAQFDQYPTFNAVYDKTVDVSTIEKILDPKRLNRIVTRNESIEFIPSSTERDDFPGQYALQFIRKKNWQNTLLQEIEFEQSYFNPSGCSSPDCKRLKLNAYKINPITGSQPSIKFSFAYNENENLPDFNGPSQDYWGYYNNNGFGNLIPGVSVPNVGASGTQTINLSAADRSPDATKTKANILTQITLPKGGTVNFEYELNNYYDATSSTNKDWGGLRIKRIRQNDGFSTTNEMVTEYDYYDKNNSSHSSGEVNPIRRLYDIHFFGKYCLRNSNSVRETSKDLIRYKNVTVKMPGKGKTVNEFTSFSSNPDVQPTKLNYEFIPGSGTNSSCTWHSTYTGDVNNDAGSWGDNRSYERGLLYHSWVYNETGTLLSETENTYEFNHSAGNIVKVPSLRGRLFKYSTFPYQYGYSGYFHNLEFYYYESNWFYLTSTVTKTYDELDPTKFWTDQIDLTYNPDIMQVIEKKTYTSDGRIIREKNKYPQDFADLSSYTGFDPELKAIKLMQANGINQFPIESFTTVEENGSGVEKISSGIYTKYIKLDQSNTIKPYRVFSIKTNDLLSNFSEGYVDLTQNKVVYDSHYKLDQEREYLDNPTKFNFLSSKTEFGLPQRLLYSSFYQNKVIGKVTNAFLDNDYQNPYGPANDVGFNDFDSYINDDGDGEQQLWNLTGLPWSIVNTQSHTGDYSYLLGTSDGTMEITFMTRSIIPSTTTTTAPQKKYLISLWARTENNFTSGNANIKVHLSRASGSQNLPTGVVVDLSSPINNTYEKWQRFELLIDLPSYQPYGNMKINFSLENHDVTEVYVDDIVLSPIDAACEFYIYNNLGQKTAVLDGSGNPQGSYEYDGLGRLEWVYDKDKNVLAHYTEYPKNFTNTNDHYSVEKMVFKNPKSKDDVNSQNYNEDDYIKSRTYTDGLGRPLQSIVNKQSFGGNDMVSFHAYDQYGNEDQLNLPYAGSGDDGVWKADPLTDQRNFYHTADKIEHSDDPFSAIVREDSPWQRVQEAGSPGTAWQPGTGHTMKKHYSLNAANEVSYWTYQTSSPNGAISNSNYAEQTLTKDITLDEEDHEVINFYDKEGKLVCSKRLVNIVSNPNGIKTTFDYTNGNSSEDATLNLVSNYQSTYYVYNKLGKLMYIIPPRAIEIMDNTLSFTESDVVFKEQITAMYYDSKGRLIEKKLPGSGKKCFVYDKMDRPVMMRDANQESNDDFNWVFVKYDVLGRPVLTGVYKTQDDPIDLQNSMDNLTMPLFETRDANTITTYYTNDVFPSVTIAESQILSVNFYDDYSFDHTGFEFNPTLYTEYSTNTFGLPTGRKINILGTSTWLTSSVYYDDKHRAIQLQDEHQLQGKDEYDMQYDFEGKTTHTERHHSKTGASDVVFQNNFVYDRMNRLLQINQQVDNDDEIILAQYEYNELGQVTRKILHQHTNDPGAYMQGVDYRYNIRGWLKSINNASLTDDADLNIDMDDVFGEELFYNENSITSPVYAIKDFYNGNISAIKWKSKAPQTDGTTLQENMYVYRYDDLNQLTAGYYVKNTMADPTSFDANAGRYNEWESYDMAGNLLTLNRNGRSGNIDRLTYTYSNNGNRLQNVEDAGISDTKNFYEVAHNAVEYSYDANGNIITDQNKDLQYAYNFLNLPQTISKSTGTIEYTYDGSGRKLTQSSGGKTHEYINGIEYEDGNFLFANTAEGRVRPKNATALNTSSFVYDYFIKDHLGNVRTIITEEELDPEVYLASMELDRDALEQQLFEHIPETREARPAGEPYDPLYWNDDYVSEISATKPIGHAKVIQMNEGDGVDIDVRYYFENGYMYTNNNVPVADILLNLANSFMPGYSAGTLTTEQMLVANNTFVQNGQLNAFLVNSIVTVAQLSLKNIKLD